jgi:hypothetical protein
VFIFDDLVKIGITNNKLPQRLAALRSSSGKDFNLFLTFHSDGETIFETEKNLLAKLRSKYAQPNRCFAGYTETFISADTSLILLDILGELKLRTGEMNV